MIYIIRRHNDFIKTRDITIGAFSTFANTMEAIRSDMLENGYYDEAMAMDIPENGQDPFEIACGLKACAIRFPFGQNPFSMYYEVKTMTLDGE